MKVMLLKPGQVGWGFGQPGLVEDALTMVVVLELDDLDGPFQIKPFCDSRILLSFFLFVCFVF